MVAKLKNYIQMIIRKPFLVNWELMGIRSFAN